MDAPPVEDERDVVIEEEVSLSSNSSYNVTLAKAIKDLQSTEITYECDPDGSICQELGHHNEEQAGLATSTPRVPSAGLPDLLLKSSLLSTGAPHRKRTAVLDISTSATETEESSIDNKEVHTNCEVLLDRALVPQATLDRHRPRV